MLIATNAIVLSKLKYRDNDLIIKCYTQQYGTLSFLLRGVLKSRKGKVQTAYFQMLSQLQVVMDYKNNRVLHAIKEVKLNHLYANLHTHVIKGTVVMFLAEVLTGVLKEEEPNEFLFSYLETALLWFDSHEEHANFHLLFLLKLSKYLGFYPDDAQMESPFFDLQDGKFVLNASHKECLSGEESKLLKTFLGATFDMLPQIKINSKQRHSFLRTLMRYYELHMGNFKSPRSLEVLHQIFK